MPSRPKKHASQKEEERKVLSKWKKTITAEAGRRLRGKPRQAVPDTSAIPWLSAK